MGSNGEGGVYLLHIASAGQKLYVCIEPDLAAMLFNAAGISARTSVLLLAVFVVYLVGIRGARDLRRADCLKFIRYIPSHWETQWLHDSTRQQNICGALKLEADHARTWLDSVEMSQQIALSHTPTIDDVWPKFVYRDECNKRPSEIVVPIEPNVGLLRNPHAVACSTDEFQAVDMENREYFVLAPTAFTRFFPGRKLLFDVGSGGSFQSSLAWLVDTYQQQGITFDEIWSWEAREVDPHSYWKSVPAEWTSKLHFYNTFATADLGDVSPTNMIKQMHSAGDFVVVKLDIDNEQIESEIVHQLLDNAEVIGEVFFEMHFDAPEMRPYFGQLQTTFNESLSLFHRFRSAGLRLHYWP